MRQWQWQKNEIVNIWSNCLTSQVEQRRQCWRSASSHTYLEQVLRVHITLTTKGAVNVFARLRPRVVTGLQEHGEHQVTWSAYLGQHMRRRLNMRSS
jgi:hypothetical protein